MLRQVNEVLKGAFPEWYGIYDILPTVNIMGKGPSNIKFYPVGLMSYQRAERMRVQAMNTNQQKEYSILAQVIQTKLLPFRWNQMDMEFGV